MNITLWTIAGWLAVALLVGDAITLIQPRQDLPAAGLVSLTVGAVITHLRRPRARVTGANLALLGLARLVARGRSGPESFTG